MQAGVPVSEMTIVGIPYRIDEDTKKISEVTVVTTPVPYSIEFAEFLFPELDPELDKTRKKTADEKVKEDPRLEFVKTIENLKLKEKFLEMLANLDQLFKYYSRNKDAKSVYDVLDNEANKSNRLKLQHDIIKNALDNWEDVSDFLNVQSQFLDFIDSIGPVLINLNDYYTKISNTVSATPEAKAEKLNELSKIKNMLMGYKNMLDELLPDREELQNAAINNPLANSINQYRGEIEILLKKLLLIRH
jgi:DNA repair ATPase RecN